LEVDREVEVMTGYEEEKRKEEKVAKRSISCA